MKLSTSPQNAAVLSNVASLGEYRINNSPKAFAILSSGLYANKVRAIIRELSCNAWDSHVAAGNIQQPFDIHLPTTLEPWFAIRDYGIGLSHDDVVKIYTTYFESTKTESNDFIGALGLGSKSPFSYTDNYTVETVKNGRRGIYSAYINDQGVPAISLMHEEENSLEPSGVQVKFAVKSEDTRKFYAEARTVFTYFAVKPKINVSDFEIASVKYKHKDIVPGVSQLSDVIGSVAVMGNIAYPIDVNILSKQDNSQGYCRMLKANLELHFDIGELDFQASREGLSYVPLTINSIFKKLDALRIRLNERVCEDVSKIDNWWLRMCHLNRIISDPLWAHATESYVAKHDDLKDFFDQNRNLKPLKVNASVVENFNIDLKAFVYHRYQATALTEKALDGVWTIPVSEEVFFARNDTKTGALERGKRFYRSHDLRKKYYSIRVFVASALDKSKPMKFDEFMQLLRNPSQVVKVSDWPQAAKVKSSSPEKVQSLIISPSSKEVNTPSWRPVTNFDDRLSGSEWNFYLPLKGYVVSPSKQLHKNNHELGVKEFLFLTKYLFNEVHTVYGLRSQALEKVKKLPNWVNLEDYVISKLSDKNKSLAVSLAMSSRNFSGNLKSAIAKMKPLLSEDHKLYQMANLISVEGQLINNYSKHKIDRLINCFYQTTDNTVVSFEKEFVAEIDSILTKYPMLSYMVNTTPTSLICEYVKTVDELEKYLHNKSQLML